MRLVPRKNAVSLSVTHGVTLRVLAMAFMHIDPLR